MSLYNIINDAELVHDFSFLQRIHDAGMSDEFEVYNRKFSQVFTAYSDDYL
ncbi:MAG: hypothetical protein MI922_16580 [Bacteroidales bacterium]|nr:hypothetical protein [Bacteroidales bacterium]